MSGRSRRKAAPKQMSAALWVGYTDDSETPEMIMKKFEALEKIQQEQREKEAVVTTETTENGQQSEAKESELNQDQLETLFKETSSFSIGMLNKGVVQTDHMENDSVDMDELFQELDLDEEEEVYGDEESFFGYDDDDGDRKARPKASRVGISRVGQLQSSFMEVSTDEGFTFTVRKKIRFIDPLETTFTRIPPLPTPLSWAKTIEPYTERDAEGLLPKPANATYFEEDILKYDLKNLKNNNFIAILMDPPWKIKGREGSQYVTCAQLEKLNLAAVLKAGYMFIWTEKEIIPQVVQYMGKKSFVYVENLVWVLQEPNNSIRCDEYQYIRKSKKSLLIFKHTNPETAKLELRHQQS